MRVVVLLSIFLFSCQVRFAPPPEPCEIQCGQNFNNQCPQVYDEMCNSRRKSWMK